MGSGARMLLENHASYAGPHGGALARGALLKLGPSGAPPTAAAHGTDEPGVQRFDADDMDRAFRRGWDAAILGFGPTPIDKSSYALQLEDRGYRLGSWVHGGRM